MKKHYKTFKIAFSALTFTSLLFFQACKDDEDKDDNGKTTPTKNMMELISEPKYSIFKSIVDKAGLAAMLTGTTEYTVFVPDNDKFNLAGILNFDAVSATDCGNFVKLHMMAGRLAAGTVSNNKFYPTLFAGGPSGAPISAFVTTNGTVMSVNSKQVVNTFAGTNGVVHDVTDMLVWHDNNANWRIPTVYDLIISNPLLGKYRVGVDIESATTKTYFMGTDLYSAFATDDAGLDKYLKAISKQMANMTPSERRRLYNNSTIPGNLKSSAMATGSLTTKGDNLNLKISGSTVTINDTVSVKIMDGQGSNGVLHIVDKTLNY